jgi:outer membrane protein assembly factor BamB
VIVVDRSGKIVWQYGQAGVTGSGPNELNVPVFAIQLPNRNIMVVDQANNRVIEIGRFSMSMVWSYGPTSGPGALNNPNSAELLRNGHVLIADENNNRVIEITRAGKIVWQYSKGISAAAFASRLPNGNTLIVDSGHARIIEVTRDMQLVFQYFTNRGAKSNPSPLPTNAVQLRNGDMAIADQFNNRAIIIDEEKDIVFQDGLPTVVGNGPNQLNGPYTAFAIGDYTGQTPPPVDF